MSEQRKHIEVVAAIIKKDNTILATQRGYGDMKLLNGYLKKPYILQIGYLLILMRQMKCIDVYKLNIELPKSPYLGQGLFMFTLVVTWQE